MSPAVTINRTKGVYISLLPRGLFLEDEMKVLSTVEEIYEPQSAF